MGKAKEDIIGTRIGIYDVLYKCDFKSNCGHTMYHVRCSECGWESDMNKSDIGRAKTCTHIGKLTQEQLDMWYEQNKKQCLYCGENIPLGNLGFNEYRNRKFCNNSCAASYNNKKITVDTINNNICKRIIVAIKNYCKNCGKEISPKNIYCSLKCQQNFQYKSYIIRWKNGEENGMCGKYSVSKHIKRYLYEKYNNRCSRCGWGEINMFTGKVPLEIHHKDGDYTNNDESNLDLLCPNCHSLTETYKAANKGRGRKDRKKYYLN